ncbi:MAG: HAMP domain-containing sensor histidine kinase [Candidatus Omnitrophota bacterium]
MEEKKKNQEGAIKKKEISLLGSMEKFKDLFEQSPVGMGIYDAQGKAVDVNKSYLDLFGVSSVFEMRAINLFKAYNLSKKDIRQIQEGNVVQEEVECNFDALRFETSRKGIAVFFLAVAPFFREKEIIGYIIQVKDITDWKKKQRLNKIHEISRLISSIAHEINNPLGVISMRLKVAQMKNIQDEDIKKTLDVISAQCDLVKDIIRRLSLYARRGTDEKVPLDLKITLRTVVDKLKAHFNRSNIVLKHDMNVNLPLILGDEKQMHELFMNVIHNSAEAMPEGGFLFIKAVREKSFLRVTIRDTGKGIAKDVLGRVFEPFYSTKQKGTGLGLTVCRAIVLEHEGKMTYKSKEGEGTTVTISLPVVSH